MNKSYFILSEEKEPQLFELIKDFSLAVGVGIFIVDINGHRKSEIMNCHALCQTIQSTANANLKCKNCQMNQLIKPIKKGTVENYICHAGFTQIPLPIYINNILVGFVIIGQIAERQNKYLLEETADKIVEARNEELNYFSQTRLTKIVDLFINLARNTLNTKKSQRKLDIRYLKEINDLRENMTEKEEIIKAVQYIKNNLQRTLSLEEVANQVYLSQYYFSKLFKKELGMNFVTYLNYQRVVRAKELLIQSELSIEEISKKVGFSQTSYFCKIFKGLVSNCPSGFRKQMKDKKLSKMEPTLAI